MEITSNQTAEIRNYLASKKLQLDLFLEVEDHFVSQISQLMKDKNIGFEEAFLQTKILWTGELKMVPASILSFKKISVVEKKIVDRRLNKVLLNSILLLPFIFGLNYFIPDAGVFVQIILFSVILLLVGLSLIKKKLKFRDYLFLGFHPLIFKMLFAFFLIQFLLIPIFTGFTTPFEIGEFSKNYIWFTVFVGIAQIQLLYANFNNKKVLL